MNQKNYEIGELLSWPHHGPTKSPALSVIRILSSGEMRDAAIILCDGRFGYWSWNESGTVNCESLAEAEEFVRNRPRRTEAPSEDSLSRAAAWCDAFDRQTRILEEDPDGRDESLDCEYDECDEIMVENE